MLMRSVQEKINEKTQRTTSCDQQKRYILFKKLTSQSSDQFRDVNIDQFDLNITQSIEELQDIDSSVTPLIYASYFGLKDIMKILLKNKQVDVDQQTENNRQTPLTTACQMGNYEIVRLLLLSHAEVNKPNLLNQIPLTVILFRLVQEPASFQNKKICFLIADILIKEGADLNWIIDKKNGYSLLHYFCNLKMKMNKNQKQLNYQIIKYLLEKGANVQQKSLNDKSCWDLLENHCNKQEILPLLDKYKNKQKPIVRGDVKVYKKIDANFFKL